MPATVRHCGPRQSTSHPGGLSRPNPYDRPGIHRPSNRNPEYRRLCLSMAHFRRIACQSRASFNRTRSASCDEAHKCLKKIELTAPVFWLESAAEKTATSSWSHPRTQELESWSRNRIVTHPYQPGLSRVAPRFCEARLVCFWGSIGRSSGAGVGPRVQYGIGEQCADRRSSRRLPWLRDRCGPRVLSSPQALSSLADAAAAIDAPPIPIARRTSERILSLSAGLSRSIFLTFSRPWPRRSPL